MLKVAPTRSETSPAPQGTPPALLAERFTAERLVVLGWTRAILLQFAHPLVAAGIFDHSGFRANTWAAMRRLHLTVDAMLALAFGDPAARDRALEGIRAIHRRVNGRLPMPVGPFPAGTRYSAEDPDLVLWVHATLMESVPMTYELLVAPVPASARDHFCQEAAPMAIALGAREHEVPQSAAGTRRYIESMYRSGAVTVGPQARELAGALLAPPFGRVGTPAARILELLAIGLLPPAIRRQYGFEWSATDERDLARAVMMLRTLRRVVPDGVALWRRARR